MIIAVAVAHIVHGVVIISSPGFTSKAPIDAISPDVQELTLIEYFTLKNLLHCFSKFFTWVPPKKSLLRRNKPR